MGEAGLLFAILARPRSAGARGIFIGFFGKGFERMIEVVRDGQSLVFQVEISRRPGLPSDPR